MYAPLSKNAIAREFFDRGYSELEDGKKMLIDARFEQLSTKDHELHEEAVREIRDSMERGQRQRDRWPENLNRAMSELAKLFPTMHGVPGTDPWDVHQLLAWMNTGAPTTGSWHAAMFLLGVWNPHTKWNQEGVKMRKGASGKFDLFVAMQGWDQQHIDAAREWIANPFFP